MRTFWGLFIALALLTGCASSPDVVLPTAPAPATTTPTTASSKGMPPSEPTELRIPKIGAKSSLVPLGLNPDETVEVPPVEQPMQAGWYELARTPGEAGPAVVLGHVDGNKQPGIFFRLKELVAGDEVEVSRKDGTTAKFRVRRTEQIAKASFPTEAVYGDTDEPELRLITCGGSFDQAAHSYRDNIIVYATLI
ncbi:class F sortase [Lentzea sp. NPDC051838]|uniref:class F sortase n=1 Tax=Lentzea sp. NPDC051838 TaxID=3154849 RepID=UPI00343D39C7